MGALSDGGNSEKFPEHISELSLQGQEPGSFLPQLLSPLVTVACKVVPPLHPLPL